MIKISDESCCQFWEIWVYVLFCQPRQWCHLTLTWPEPSNKVNKLEWPNLEIKGVNRHRICSSKNSHKTCDGLNQDGKWQLFRGIESIFWGSVFLWRFPWKILAQDVKVNRVLSCDQSLWDLLRRLPRITFPPEKVSPVHWQGTSLHDFSFFSLISLRLISVYLGFLAGSWWWVQKLVTSIANLTFLR